MSEALLARVLAEAPRLPFVTLLHWLERLLGVEVGAAEAEPRVRLRHDPSLTFHAGDVRGAERTTSDKPQVVVTTSFAGLTGAVSPLPTMLLEELPRDDHDELAEGPLLGLMQQRLLSLLYRGLLKFDLARAGDAAPARTWVLQLAGLPSRGGDRVAALSTATLLHLAPLLVVYPANAERLRVGVRALFVDLLQEAEVSVRVQQGGFVRITEQARARLGIDLRLGRTSALGDRCRAPSAAIALSLGPLSRQACAALGPGGARAEELRALVRLLVPETIATEVALHPGQGRAPALGRGARLKRDSWLTGQARPQPVCFTVC